MCWTNPDVQMISNNVFSFECQPHLSLYAASECVITIPWFGGYWMLVAGRHSTFKKIYHVKLIKLKIGHNGFLS